mmetsp:Transcript_18947/g.27943  ORF Transcript_18947/g.27943 Transcript_18947/m.27943 type:complete len:171 (+) Transcript_18947:59-571(+)
MRYVRTDGMKYEFLPEFPPLNVLLVNTLVPGRSTRNLVAKVSAFKDKYSDLVQSIFEAINGISNEFIKRHRSMSADELGLLMNTNHCLLGALGVSHPSLEKVMGIASGHKCWGKLTGGGGGGCAIILFPQNFQSDAKQLLTNELIENGFECYESEIGGNGVMLHEKWPGA